MRAKESCNQKRVNVQKSCDKYHHKGGGEDKNVCISIGTFFCAMTHGYVDMDKVSMLSISKQS